MQERDDEGGEKARKKTSPPKKMTSPPKKMTTPPKKMTSPPKKKQKTAAAAQREV
jgi:hypothetical protein